jgi:hypothetical protein
MEVANTERKGSTIALAAVHIPKVKSPRRPERERPKMARRRKRGGEKNTEKQSPTSRI